MQSGTKFMAVFFLVVGIGALVLWQSFFSEWNDRITAQHQKVKGLEDKATQLEKLRPKLAQLEQEDAEAQKRLDQVREYLSDHTQLDSLLRDLKEAIPTFGLSLEEFDPKDGTVRVPGKVNKQMLTITVSNRVAAEGELAGIRTDEAQTAFLNWLSRYQRIQCTESLNSHYDPAKNLVYLKINGFVPYVIPPQPKVP